MDDSCQLPHSQPLPVQLSHGYHDKENVSGICLYMQLYISLDCVCSNVCLILVSLCVHPSLCSVRVHLENRFVSLYVHVILYINLILYLIMVHEFVLPNTR